MNYFQTISIATEMQSKDGTIVGQKGVKYGLQKPVSKSSASTSSKSRPINVFGDDSDEEDVGVQVMRQADKKRAAAKVQAVYEAALADDPSVFDYDGVYDTMQQQKLQPKQQEKLDRKSRYIAQLKDQAEERKREADVAYERKMLKDRVKEDHLFSDKEVFVTSAYRKKLEEQKKWLEDEKRKEEEEKKQDVRKVGHMGNFYANLLNKNVAFGTANPTGASIAQQGVAETRSSSNPLLSATAEEASTVISATTASRQGAQTVAGGSSKHEDDGLPALAREVSSEGHDGEGEAATGPSDYQPDDDIKAKMAAIAAKAGIHLDKYDLLRLEAERVLKQKPREAGGAGFMDVGTSTAKTTLEDETEGHRNGSDTKLKPAAPGDDVPSIEETAAALSAGKRRNDDTSVQSARERYMARKKHPGGA